jgi:hypothetical protein
VNPDDRWAPAQITGLAPSLVAGLKANIPPAMLPAASSGLTSFLSHFDIDTYYDEYRWTLQYAQAGLRFTTTIGSSDFGMQYYYGRLPRPAIDVRLAEYFSPASLFDPAKIDITVDYNDYHQIGVDYAQVIAGFNLRAEVAANITEDLDGARGDIYNPSIAWSLGFDRDAIAGINVNLQAAESIRLFHDKIGNDPMVIDTEDGKEVTSTRLTLILAKKFFRDSLELKATGLWDIEEKGFLIMPAVAWTKNDVSVELSGGIFGGDKDSELGQYRENHFLKAAITYSF